MRVGVVNFSLTRQKIALGIALSLLIAPSISFGQSTNSAQKQINSKGGLVAGLAAKLKTSEQQIASLVKQITQKDQELETLRLGLDEQKKKVSALESQDADKSNQIAETDAVIKAFEVTLQKNQKELAVLREKEKALRELTAQFASQKSLIDGMNTKIQEQDGLVNELQSRLDATKNKLNATENDLGSVGGKIGDMEKNLGAHDTKIRDLQADLDQALYQTRERDAEIGRLRSDVISAKSSHRGNRKTIEELELHRIILGGLLAVTGFGLLLSFRRRR